MIISSTLKICIPVYRSLCTSTYRDLCIYPYRKLCKSPCLLQFIEDCPPMTRLKLLQMVKSATHLRHPLVHYQQTRKVVVKSELPIAFHTEGEMFYTEQYSIGAEVIPDKLNLIVR